MRDSHHLQQGMKEIKRKVSWHGGHPPDWLEMESGEEGDSHPEGVLGGRLERFEQVQQHPRHSNRARNQHEERERRGSPSEIH